MVTGMAIEQTLARARPCREPMGKLHQNARQEAGLQ